MGFCDVSPGPRYICQVQEFGHASMRSVLGMHVFIVFHAFGSVHFVVGTCKLMTVCSASTGGRQLLDARGKTREVVSTWAHVYLLKKTCFILPSTVNGE